MCKKLQLLGTSSPRPSTVALPLDLTGGLPSPEPPDWPVFILGLSGGIFPSPPQKKIRNLPKKSTRPKNQRHEFMAG